MNKNENGLKLNQEKAQPMPMGAVPQRGGINFAIRVEAEEEIVLCLYRKEEQQSAFQFSFSSQNRIGDVRYLFVEGINPEQWEYNYCYESIEKNKKGEKEKKKIYIKDYYARKVIGRERWGVLPKEPLRYGFVWGGFDWQEDKSPNIPLEDTILYRLHTRGFTKHSSSKVKNKGTFAGIIEKIPYLKELGVTMIELLPSYEFDEIILPELGNQSREDETIRLNYWGYGDGYYFAPKSSYGKNKGKRDSSVELKELVRELHNEGMEISLEFYFIPGTPMELILDCLIYWRMEYHIDAFHINQNGVDMTMLAKNPYLSDCKLFGNEWDIYAIYGEKTPKRKRLAAMNDGFMMDARRFLKADENQMATFLHRFTSNPSKESVINYIANHDSLTLQDLVMYERHHNELNGENNQDGNPFNYSWNCGVEGESRRKKILERRSQQMKNALVMVLFSQGIPMLLAGDEFARTKHGNNNAYCQDNEISWLNWKLSKKGQELLEFTKALISFRKSHKILHMKDQLKMMDYGAIGRPDLSYHGTKAWYPDMDTYTRHVGVLYCGAYAKNMANGETDEDIFIAYNIHWEIHEFDLPRPSKKKIWVTKLLQEIETKLYK